MTRKDPAFTFHDLGHTFSMAPTGKVSSGLFDELLERQLRAGRKWSPVTAPAKSEPYYRQFYKRRTKQ